MANRRAFKRGDVVISTYGFRKGDRGVVIDVGKEDNVRWATVRFADGEVRTAATADLKHAP